MTLDLASGSALARAAQDGANRVRPELLELAGILETGTALYLIHVGFDRGGVVRRVRATLSQGDADFAILEAGPHITQAIRYAQAELEDFRTMPGPIGDVGRTALDLAAEVGPIVREAHAQADAREART